MKKTFIFCAVLVAAFSTTVFGQWTDSGKLNAWTAGSISRIGKEGSAPASLTAVRVAKNKGFDRVVFEFTGDLPNYKIELTGGPIVATGEDEVKISGQYFAEINFQPLLFPEDENYKYEKIRKAGLNLPVVSEVQEIEWFEGYRPFAIGLKAKKLYRVQQLTNPTRLVVDFKQ